MFDVKTTSKSLDVSFRENMQKVIDAIKTGHDSMTDLVAHFEADTEERVSYLKSLMRTLIAMNMISYLGGKYVVIV